MDCKGCKGERRDGIISADLRFGHICIGWFGVGLTISDGLDIFWCIICSICRPPRHGSFIIGYYERKNIQLD